MSLYQIVLLLHILAAVIGMGPLFVAPLFTSRLRSPGADAPSLLGTLDRIGMFPRIGGPLLVVTGVIMGISNPALWRLAWLKIAIALIVLMLALGPVAMAPLVKRLAQLLPQLTKSEAQTQFSSLARRLHALQVVSVTIVVAILVLMVTKPF